MTKIEVADCASSPCDARLGFGSFHNLDFGVHRTHLSRDHESSSRLTCPLQPYQGLVAESGVEGYCMGCGVDVSSG